ncbi:hypothetical protein [Pedobacter sp. D749]|uniref:hypothetical protein n=1 Tax=Pedobacter sp. D749 TaxID=2856523 RepID=UPI001C55F0DE|nr:hypothetical protein [Pedobacter sp. D749]QXU41462.1 hypothetical protein KYH19_21060 [Pedobacter sp. D749]
MTSLEALNLRYNPFSDTTPSKGSDRLIWADMHAVKSKLESSYADCIENDSKQLILNWGPYGGGKTFSAYYFLNKYAEDANLCHIYLRCPKDGAKATDELFKGIIDELSFEFINSHISALINEKGSEALIKYLTPKAGREYANAIILLGSTDDDIKNLMNRFMYSGLTKTELKKLNLPKDIQTDADSIKFLTGLLSCFSIDNGKVVIWLDEMEDLIYFAPKHYKAFSQILRDLTDHVSPGFLIFLNFTMAEAEETTIELILGGALWSRITRKIRYTNFTKENGVSYAKELLNHAKIDQGTVAPIDENVLNLVLDFIANNHLTPREINKHLSSLIGYARTQDASIIDNAIFDTWLTEYEEDN